MPPKSRKKIRRLSELPDAPITSTANISGVVATDNSQHGFIKLPSELHLMILSSWPTIPDEEILANPTNIRSSEDGPDYLGRFRVLLALSQTCRALRAFYLPLCWERLQSCMLSAQSDTGIKILVEGLKYRVKV